MIETMPKLVGAKESDAVPRQLEFGLRGAVHADGRQLMREAEDIHPSKIRLRARHERISRPYASA